MLWDAIEKAKGQESYLGQVYASYLIYETYYTHTTMSQITATGQYRQAITNFGSYVRLNYTVGGTSFTFAAVGDFKN